MPCDVYVISCDDHVTISITIDLQGQKILHEDDPIHYRQQEAVLPHGSGGR